MRTLALAGMVAAASAVSACGSTSAVVGPGTSSPVSATTAAATPRGVHNRVAAEALARSLLQRAVLPVGARRVARPPSHALATAPQRPGTPNLAQRTEFFRSDRSMGQLVAFFRAHPPEGAVRDGSGSGSAAQGGVTTSESLVDAIGGMPAGVDAQILLTAAPAGSGASAGIRVDAQVMWLPAKPAWAAVPSTDVVAVVTRTRPRAPTRRVVVTDRSTVAALRRGADSLQMALPGAHGCPADMGLRYAVSFARRVGARPDRTFAGGFCGSFLETGPSGHPKALLGDDDAFDRTYRQVLRSASS